MVESDGEVEWLRFDVRSSGLRFAFSSCNSTFYLLDNFISFLILTRIFFYVKKERYKILFFLDLVGHLRTQNFKQKRSANLEPLFSKISVYLSHSFHPNAYIINSSFRNPKRFFMQKKGLKIHY